MITYLDAFIGILIIFITITPFIWDGKKRNIILIVSELVCIGLYLFQGFSKYEEAKEFDKMNEKSLAVNSDNRYAADAWVYLGICKDNQGQKKEALDCFKRAISIDKYYKDAKWWLD